MRKGCDLRMKKGKRDIKNEMEVKSGYNKDETIIRDKKRYDTKMRAQETKESDKKENRIMGRTATEDVTAYGEFISSYFAWIPPEKQKERAKELDEATKGDKARNTQIK